MIPKGLMMRAVKYPHRKIVRLDDTLNEFIAQYSSNNDIDTSTTIRTMLEIGLTVLIQQEYKDGLPPYSSPGG